METERWGIIRKNCQGGSMKDQIFKNVFVYSKEEALTEFEEMECFEELQSLLRKNGFRYAQLHKLKDCIIGTINLHPRSSRFADRFECPYYLDYNRFLFIMEDEGEKYVRSFLEELGVGEEENVRVWFCRLLEELLGHDMERMQDAEEAFYNIEERMMDKHCDFILPSKEIIHYRKLLLERSFYYQQMADLCDMISVNEFGFFEESEAEHIKDTGRRADRLYAYVQELRDYLVQLWDLYEQQVDVQQNHTMRVLTIVTTIFLPLSLIASWYGMNFDTMPGLHHPYGYWITLGIAVLIVLGEIIFFCKKKYL